MEFLPQSTFPPPKNLYPCLATITITPPSATDSNRSRRLSTGSSGGGGDEDNSLKRIISGGRRKTSFGQAAEREGDRRKSFTTGVNPGGSAVSDDPTGTGTWYWRVQAGVTETHLILLPLSQPPNPLLTTRPQPLSQAMPSHSASAHGQGDQNANWGEGDGSITGKIKNLFRRSSTSTGQDKSQKPSADEITSSATTVVDHDHERDRIIDQNGRGQQLPSAEANAVGATNANANAEMGWPGVLGAGGEKLGAVVVDLRGLEKSKVHLKGGKKGEGSYVLVPVNSHFGNLVHGMIEPLGKTHHDFPKSGSLKFEFDKDWIGAKGEAELLHHYIVNALDERPSHIHEGATSAHRAPPEFETFQLGQAQGGQAQTQAPAMGTGGTGMGTGITA